MYCPNKTQMNPNLSALQRTFYPKHVNYFGDGSGRDIQVTYNNGTLNKVDKRGMMGHHGVHLKQYNNSNGPNHKPAPSPAKEPTTFYYQSDGTGRDSYVLQNNGGYRPEFNIRVSGDRLFYQSLRDHTKSPVRSPNSPVSELANFDTYQNWPSVVGKQVHKKTAKMQKDLIMRLSKGSPERETTINYIMNNNDGQGVIKMKSISSFQGAREPYYSSQSRIKDQRNLSKDKSVLMTTSKLLDNRKMSLNSSGADSFMKKRRQT